MPDLQYSWPDWRLKLHRREIFDVDSLALAVKSDDQRESHSHFCCGDGDDEKDHYLAVQVVIESREGHQRKVASVKHQLQRHVNQQQIAPDYNSEQSNQKQPGAHEENMLQRHVGHSRVLLLKSTVPIIATRSRTETIS